MTLRRGRGASHTFTAGPWRVADGDPTSPRAVLGVPVVKRLISRPARGVALVRLADRRYALTGPTVAVGLPRQLERFLRRSSHGSFDDRWLAEIRGAIRRDREEVMAENRE